MKARPYRERIRKVQSIPNVEVHKACQIAERVAATQEPFSIQTVGVGAFPNPDQPRTLWLGCEQPEDEPLNALHEKLEDAYDELRVAPDKKRYRPHITLGRIKRAGPETRDLAGRIRNYPPFDPIETDVTELIVFGSFLDAEGPTYNVLGRAPLG